MSLGTPVDGARSADHTSIIEHMRCPRCGYPIVRRDDGREWCSVFGWHTVTIAGMPEPQRKGARLVRLVIEHEDEKRRHLKAVG